MYKAELVSNFEQLKKIHLLNQQNLKLNLSKEICREEGFVSWLYPLELLKQMHLISPSVIVQHEGQIAGYALTATKEMRPFHPDLDIMFQNLQELQYEGRSLAYCNFYCMGQICVAKNFRGQGIVNLLYQKHKEINSKQYEFILTEISTANLRSLKAHEKIGFKKIYNYRDKMDDWDVVVWNWN